MNCNDARAWLAVRRELSYAQEEQVRQHLVSCRTCARAWQHEERSLSVLRNVAVTPTVLAPKRYKNVVASLDRSTKPHRSRFVAPRYVGDGLSVFPFLLVLGLLYFLLPSLRVSEPQTLNSATGPSSVPAGSLDESSMQTAVATPEPTALVTTATSRPITQADITATMAAGRAVALTQLPAPTPTLPESGPPPPTPVVPTQPPLTATAEAHTSIAQTQTALAFIPPTPAPPSQGYPAPGTGN